MKWLKDPLKGRIHEERIVQRFLWFPLHLDNRVRWLETACVLEKVEKIDVGGSYEWGKFKHYWVPQRFVD